MSPNSSCDCIVIPVEVHVPVVTSDSAYDVLVIVTFAPVGPAESKSQADDMHPPPTLVDDGIHESTRRSERRDLPALSVTVMIADCSAVAARDTIRRPEKARLVVQDCEVQVLIDSTGCMVVRAVMYVIPGADNSARSAVITGQMDWERSLRW